jgi:hypothetical protein
MRWCAGVAAGWLGTSGCIVYADGTSTWSGSSSSTWSTPAPPRDGQIEVSWQLGGDGCEAAGIDVVEVDLDGDVTAFPCVDGGGLATARTGKHRLEMRGLDPQGVVRYEGAGGRVQVRPQVVEVAPTVVLAAMPARLAVTWYFEDGHLCGANGVVDVEADLFDDHDTLAASTTTGCEDGEIVLEDVEAGSYVLMLLGRDGNGQATFRADLAIDAQPGDFLSVDLMLSE